MRAGTLRHRVAIQTRSETTSSGYGDARYTWATTTTVWGRVEPVSGDETFIGDQSQNRITHKVTLRGYSGLRADRNRLQHDGRTLGIVSVRDLDERGITLEVMCREDAN